MKRLVVFTLLFAVAAMGIYAQVSESTWQALVGKNVILEKGDGSEIPGDLMAADGELAVVVKEDGSIVEVAKADVLSIRVSKPAPEASAPAAAAATPSKKDIPLTGGFITFHPLGFLQLGPMVELGTYVSPQIALAAQYRWDALGLLLHSLASNGFEDDLSFGSMSFGAAFSWLPPAQNLPNRWYVGSVLELGFGGGTEAGGSRDYRYRYFTIGGYSGYRWRYPSGFFVNLGGRFGVAIQKDWAWPVSDPNNITYYDPTVYVVGMLELSIGWTLGKIKGAEAFVSAAAAPVAAAGTTQAETAPGAGSTAGFVVEGNLVRNPGFEIPIDRGAPIPEWTATRGKWRQEKDVGKDDFLLPAEGEYFVRGDSMRFCELQQVIDVSNFASSIDNESQRFTFTCYLASLPHDSARIVVDYLSLNDEVLSAFESRTVIDTNWQQISDSRLAPRGTRKVRITLKSIRHGDGGKCNGLHDGVALVAE